MSERENKQEDSILGYELLARVVTGSVTSEEARSLIRHRRAKSPETREIYSRKLHKTLGSDDPISKTLKRIEKLSKSK